MGRTVRACTKPRRVKYSLVFVLAVAPPVRTRRRTAINVASAWPGARTSASAHAQLATGVVFFRCRRSYSSRFFYERLRVNVYIYVHIVYVCMNMLYVRR